MLKRTLTIVSLVSVVILVTLLMTTTPATAGPFGLLVIFITAYLTSLGIMTLFLYGVSRVVANFFAGRATRKPVLPLSLNKSYYYGTVVATAPVMLMGLQSVGSLSIYEVILVALFVAIGCVYVSRRTH